MDKIKIIVMKKLILIISSAMLLMMFFAYSNAISSPVNQSENDSIQIWSSSELSNLTKIWVDEYAKINQNVRVIASTIQAENITDKVRTFRNIGFISENQLSKLNSKPSWGIQVGRDVIVPVMNSENPYKEEIYRKGLSPEDFANAITNSGKQSWGTLLDNNQTKPVNFYFLDNESIMINMIEFMQIDPLKITGKSVSGNDEMLKKIQSDKYAIGICRLEDIINAENQELDKNLSLIPIDINGNNQIDYFEDIYKNAGTLQRGIWIGKYPKSLYASIYAVANYTPAKSEDLALMKWVLTDGQQYIHTTGYSELISSERQPKVQSLYVQTPIQDIPYKSVPPLTLLLIIGISIIGLFSIYLVFRGRKFGTHKVIDENSTPSSVFGENSVMAPKGLFYDKSHTWAFMESDGLVKVGIDDFLQHITGPITKVKMRHEGEKIKKGETLFSIIQYGKQLNIQSPVSGIITKNNTMLNTDSSILNSSPYNEGWVYVIESRNWMKDIQSFRRVETYREWIKNEFIRVKEFLFSTTVDVNNLQLVMQDGGELVDNLLEHFGPEVWEEFQSEFLKQAK